MTSMGTPTSWRISPERSIPLDPARIMGILNVTPDSFSDGGRYADPAAAIAHAMSMISDGADIIDIGGESTRPGASRIAVIEQLRRVIPVIEGIRESSDVPISIDTTRADVADAALEAGADIVNDVSAGQEDSALLTLAAERQCGVILMHRRVSPEQDVYSTAYENNPTDSMVDVVECVSRFLAQHGAAAQQAGVDRASIVIDPGLGFGKSVEQNYQIIARVSELHALGFPILSAASRKSFVGCASGVDQPEQRVCGSVAISVAHYLAGVRLFRVHDVAAHRQALCVAAAMVRGRVRVRGRGPGQGQEREPGAEQPAAVTVA